MPHEIKETIRLELKHKGDSSYFNFVPPRGTGTGCWVCSLARHTFSQWSGNAIISSYQSFLHDTAVITDSTKKLGLGGGGGTPTVAHGAAEHGQCRWADALLFLIATGSQGEFKGGGEGISINAGPAALGKVISQLSSRQAETHTSRTPGPEDHAAALGGNTITYTVARATPAESHLDETLNTVQYAQRARAIQSKPRIRRFEEGDKQAIIDRLEAEATFLRD